MTRHVSILILDGVRGANRASQIYRKAALNLILELGEDVFPEPAPAAATLTPEGVEAKSVESQEPAANESTATQETATPKKPEEAIERKTVTTTERPPLKVPDSVHVRITPENLKDFVGPPVYQKDRMYSFTPPPGVSTGLGYLGNGSGAVMPVEATVRSSSLRRA